MKSIEEKLFKFMDARDWTNLKPSDLAKSISIESAELLEIFQWNNPDLEEVKEDNKKLEKIKEELADVFIYAFDLAILLNIDVKKIILDKIEKIDKKYPAELMKKDKKLTQYASIKKNHRN